MDYQNPFDPYPDPEILYRDYTTKSLYVTMRDGIRLAVDVILPSGLPEGTRIPAILQQTRYWRSSEFKAPLRWFWPIADDLNPYVKAQKLYFTSRGYALVNVDVRGTGASFGVWRYPWDPDSIEDGGEIVDWIIHQTWSNGAVGGMGISYFGSTAELLLATQHPAVKAVLTMFNHPDAYRDVAFPGGIFNQRFVLSWCSMNSSLDRNKPPADTSTMIRMLVGGVRPIDGGKGRSMLREAIRQHRDNGQFDKIGEVNFRDEVVPELDACADDICVERFNHEITTSQAKIFGWASWMDAGTADAALRRFLNYPNAVRLVIGAWNHGGTMQASPYQSPQTELSPRPVDQWREQIHFFDTYLKSIDNGKESGKTIHYYTLGEEAWQSSTQWPPPGMKQVRWYLGSDYSLTQDLPSTDYGEDRYLVDFTTSSGPLNRWWSLGTTQNQSIVYEDIENQQYLRLCYTTDPFSSDIEITGYPIVRLYVSSSTPDAAIFVYLEDITPDGKVFYITEGQLRVIHRQINTDKAPLQHKVPYHSFCREDAKPLIPGETAEISFGLNPVSVLVKKGHRLRLSIAGHDEGTFQRYPEDATPLLTFQRNLQFPSSIDMPIRSREL